MTPILFYLRARQESAIGLPAHDVLAMSFEHGFHHVRRADAGFYDVF